MEFFSSDFLHQGGALKVCRWIFTRGAKATCSVHGSPSDWHIGVG